MFKSYSFYLVFIITVKIATMTHSSISPDKTLDAD